jgi:hypothetical protein
MGGINIAQLSFTNSSSSPCDVSGTPQLELDNASGNVITTAIAAANGPYGAYYQEEPITLGQGQSANAYLAFSHLGSCPTGTTLSVQLSGNTPWEAVAGLPVDEMCGSGLLVSPLVPSSVPIFATYGAPNPAAPSVSPLNDGSGYYYGTDSGSAPCSGTTISYNGLSGRCGFYGGQIGAYWLNIPGCPPASEEGWGWNPTQATDADNATDYGGTGTSLVYLVGGPGADPAYDYTGTEGTPAPTSAQKTEADNWGTEQANTALTQMQIAKYSVYQWTATLFIDIEVGEGWEGKVTFSGQDCYPGDGYTPSPYNYSPNLNRRTFDAFWDTIANATGWTPGVYAAKGNWDDWFSGYLTLNTAYEWPFEDEATSEASGTNSPTSFSWSEASPEFFGSVTASSSQALAWQWATPAPPPSGTPDQTQDLDQVYASRFPLLF